MCGGGDKSKKKKKYQPPPLLLFLFFLLLPFPPSPLPSTFISSCSHILSSLFLNNPIFSSSRCLFSTPPPRSSPIRRVNICLQLILTHSSMTLCVFFCLFFLPLDLEKTHQIQSLLPPFLTTTGQNVNRERENHRMSSVSHLPLRPATF